MKPLPSYDHWQNKAYPSYFFMTCQPCPLPALPFGLFNRRRLDAVGAGVVEKLGEIGITRPLRYRSEESHASVCFGPEVVEYNSETRELSITQGYPGYTSHPQVVIAETRD
jgi:hypothetical protein